MKLQRVIEILEKHQNWRRDHSVPAKTEMQSPIEIGTAIDYALRELKKLNIDDVSKCNCEPPFFNKDSEGKLYCPICGIDANVC